MSSSTTQTTFNHQQLTHRILKDNSLHFILLALLFLPYTVSVSAAVEFYISSSQNLLTLKTLITILTSTCFIILPTVAGIALITFSTNHAIHHNPLTFSSTLKSLTNSKTVLLYNIVIVKSIKLIILLLAVTISLIAVTEAIKTALAYHFGLFIFSIFINLTVSYVVGIVIIFLVVVCEPTEETTILQTEFGVHSFSTVFRTGLAIVPAVSYLSVSQNFGPTANWMLVMQMGTICLQSSLMILLYVVEITVLYVHCMEASGQEITKTMVKGEVSGEYVRLVMNDADAEVVNEVAEEEDDVNGGFNYILSFLTIVWVILLCVHFYYILVYSTVPLKTIIIV